MNLQHEFDVPAAPQATLDLLLDAERVVSCLPGATLVAVAADGTWKTTMTVKLGPVAMDFANDVRIAEQDAGHVLLVVSGRDTRGRGGADATVDATLTPEGAGTHVSMSTDVRFSGQAAQLGRPSLIKDISTRLVDEFARCIRARLDAPAQPAADETPTERKPLSGLALARVAVRGALARLFSFRPRLREKGSP